MVTEGKPATRGRAVTWGAVGFVALACLLPILYSFYLLNHTKGSWLQSSYMQGTMGGWIASIVGLTVALPIGLRLNAASQEESERVAEARAEAERLRELQRTIKILESEISSSIPGLQATSAGRIHQFRFSTGRWRALTAAGDLKWIPDPTLVGDLAAAYEGLETVNHLIQEWLHVSVQPPVDIDYSGSLLNASTVITSLLADAATDALATVGTAATALTGYLSIADSR